MATDRRDLALTFAGGGNRAFYQVGLMEHWAEQVLPRVACVAACSAGAATATLLLAGRVDHAREFFAEQRVGVRRNVSFRRAARGKRPFPHDGIYRATLRSALGDGGFERIKAQPFPIRILCASFPRRLPPMLGLFVGIGAYQLEKALTPEALHPTFGERLGFAARSWDARDCETPEELVELIMSSSSTPPFTALGSFGVRPLVDGSMIDNAPAFLAEDATNIRRSLVLLTRPYPGARLGRVGKRLYVAPTESVPVTRWDYTERAPVDETLELGRREASKHQRALDSLLATE